ncbi:TonB-dependent siderophore receptor [Neisseria bacilliformis]|uniref:TonB-dependent siderophore receptor n=1 Tax=Neisseria bacilliformis TaxID=267212 RepID=UPI0030B83D99
MIVVLTPNINAYSSYTGIFKDNDTFDVTYFKRRVRGGGKFPPITGNSKEFGLKGELFDNRLNFSLAYFTMLQKGYPTFEPAGWGKCEEWHPYVPDMCTRAALEYDTTTGYKSSGFDISIAGKITPKWLVNAGFAKLKIGKPYDAPNSDSDLGDELNMDYGETYTAPAKTFKFFTRYDFTPKFSAGIGIRWNSGVRPKPWGHGYSGGEYYVSNKPKELWQPAYAVWNAMASYKFGKNAAVAVNVGNIFNKRYYTNARGNFYGKPRNFSVALKMKW